ncbi:MAG TPA: glycosyltransferase, partial [Vicinamibacterales bacterium]|nr:glycosyltransferase [Vicinamibacterales bacterium]
FGLGQLVRTYTASLKLDVSQVGGRRVDQVISLRFPSFAVRHRAHLCWLNHTMREYYDLWPEFSASISRRNRMKERVTRSILHVVDRHLLKQHATRVLAQSKTIQRRLASDFGIRAEVLYPPPPQRAYRCDGYGDYILAVSRLTPHKRVDLLVRALAEPAARGIKAVVAGDGEERAGLARLAADLGVADRVQFTGRIADAVMLDLFARCRAVCFTPIDEDYGFVTVEAFASRKAGVTCRDSGGPAEFVVDGETGFVCDPTAPSVAAALARLTSDAQLAGRLGTRAAARAADMTWDAAVKSLVII